MSSIRNRGHMLNSICRRRPAMERRFQRCRSSARRQPITTARVPRFTRRYLVYSAPGATSPANRDTIVQTFYHSDRVAAVSGLSTSWQSVFRPRSAPIPTRTASAAHAVGPATLGGRCPATNHRGRDLQLSKNVGPELPTSCERMVPIRPFAPAESSQYADSTTDPSVSGGPGGYGSRRYDRQRL